MKISPNEIHGEQISIPIIKNSRDPDEKLLSYH